MKKKSLSYVLMFFGMMLLPLLKVNALPIELDTTFKHNSISSDYLELTENKYSVDFAEGNINDQYSFKFTSDDLETDTKYILLFDYNFFVSSDNNNSIVTKRTLSTFLGSELVTGQIIDLLDDEIVKSNGKYKISAKIYPLSIFDDAYEGEIDVALIDELKAFFDINFDLSSYTPVTSKELEISNINIKDEFKLNKLTYVEDDSELEKNALTGKYDIDPVKYVVSDLIKVQYDLSIGNYNLNDNYNVIVCYNDIDCYYIDTLLNKTASNLKTLLATGFNLDMTNRLPGTYNVSVSVGNARGILYEDEFVITVPGTLENVETLLEALDDINIDNVINNGKLLASYIALSDENELLLDLDEDAIEELNGYISKYSKSIADRYTNLNVFVNFDGKPLVDSFNKIGNKLVPTTLNLYGRFVGNEALLMSVGDLLGLFNENLVGITDIRILQDNEVVTDLTKKLNNKMVLEIVSMGKTYEYKIVLLGNMISDNGLIKLDDIKKAADTIIGISTLDSSELLSYKINEDNEVNIHDIGTLNYLFKQNEDEEFEVDDFAEFDLINVMLKSDKTFARVGDTFKLYLEVKELDKNKFNGIQGLLDYNEDLFELVSIEFMDETLNWYGNINSDSTSGAFGNFLWFGNDDVIASDGKIIEFTFEAKAITDSAKISLKNVILDYYGQSLTLKNDSNEEVTDYQVDMKIERALYKDNTIKSLELSNGNIDFTSDVLSYTVHVLNTLTEIEIDGILGNEYATTEGFKKYDLTDKHTFIDLVVEAENGDLKTYKLEIVRDIEPITEKIPTPVTYQPSDDNTIKSLEITNHGIIFDKNVYEYNINVDNDVDHLELTIILNNDKATFTVSGNENFKAGKNTVVITVKAENGEEKQYSIIVNKASDDTEEEPTKEKENSKLMLIIMIALTIVGLVYLLFRKDSSDEPNFDDSAINKNNKKTNKK